MTNNLLLVSCRLAGWRLAVNSESLVRIDRAHRRLCFWDGSMATVDAIEDLWDCCPGSVLVPATHSPGAVGWVARGADMLLLVESSYFKTPQPTQAPVQTSHNPLHNLFGRVVVFSDPPSAISLRQVLEVITPQPIHPLPELPKHCSGVLFWRDHAVPVVPWRRMDQPTNYIIARSLEQRLLALPANPPIRIVPTDDATTCPDAPPQQGILTHFCLSTHSSIALLDLDHLLAPG